MPLGNAYISGNFQGQGIDFDPSLTSSNTQDSVGGTVDVFVVKLDPSLNLVWKTRFGGPGVDPATNISDEKTVGDRARRVGKRLCRRDVHISGERRHQHGWGGPLPHQSDDHRARSVRSQFRQ